MCMCVRWHVATETKVYARVCTCKCTPRRTPCAAPATQKPPAERRRPRDARAYIRPLAEHQVPHLPRKSHRHSGGDQGTQGVHPTPCSAPSPTPATGTVAETKGRQGVHPTPWQSTKCPLGGSGAVIST